MPRVSDGQGHELQLGSNTSMPVSSTTIEALLGALTATPVIDPTASGSEIALLKGIIKQLQGDGTTGKAAPVSITGSLANNQTNKVTLADTDLLTDYTPTKYEKSTLMVMTNTSGVLNLEVDAIMGSLNGGVALDAGKWYAFDIPLMSGSVYNLQISVGATVQIKWLGGV